MIFKKFSNKQGGNIGIINYLLNKRRVTNGTAKVLKGNTLLTKKIIKSISRKQKVFAGCLSFEESNIDEDIKYKLMEEFEKTLLPGIDKSFYNILWVEHTDKGRLELNMVIPKTNLLTGKRLQPYYDKIDRKRMDIWRDIQNLQYGFSDPNDPNRARTLEVPTKKIGLAKDYIELNTVLHNLVEQGQITSRDEMIELLNNSGITVTRKSESFISIKFNNMKKARRLKGGIYDRQFRHTEVLSQARKRAERKRKQFNGRDQQRICKELEHELNERMEFKSQQNRAEHSKEIKRNVHQQLENISTGFPFWDNSATNDTIGIQHTYGNNSNSHMVRFWINNERTRNTLRRVVFARRTRKQSYSNINQNLTAANEYISFAGGVVNSTKRNTSRVLKRDSNRSDKRRFIPLISGIRKLIRGVAKSLKELFEKKTDLVHYDNRSQKNVKENSPEVFLKPLN